MELLDRKLDELDECWGDETTGSRCLQHIVRSLPSELENREDVIVELCCADIEWRWRSQNKWFAATSPLIDPNSTQPQSMIPLYEGILNELGDRPDNRRRLMLAEWRARSAWGDCPDLSEFVQASGFDQSASESLLEELDALAGLRVRIEMDDAIFECQVVGEFEIGRQNINEPLPPKWLVDENRLLVARLEQTEVSRRQLVVCRTRVNEVEIRNVSRNVSIAIQSDVVSPGDCVRARLPVAFKLQSGKVSLSCNQLADA